MAALLSFNGRIRRFPYALWSWAILISQYLVSFLIFQARGDLTEANRWQFQFSTTLARLYPVPLRSLVDHEWLTADKWASNFGLVLVLICMLFAVWALAALSFRRAADAGVNGWIATFSIAPIIQIPLVLLLSVLPSRAVEERSPIENVSGAFSKGGAAAAQGVVAGIGVTLAAVAASTLLFGSYGYGLFVASPFVIGAMTAYFANRIQDMGEARTTRLVLVAAALGGLALVFTALEGIVCIVLAAPLGLGVAVVGGLLGRSIALRMTRSATHTLSAVALLPIVFAAEWALPATTSFETYQTVEIDASPEAIWRAIVTMDTIDEPLALPFRLGVAHPLRGEVLSEGVGAIRRGEFSTGIAIERVTEWIPNRKLAFVVLNEVPAMRELSPYRHVHAPHVIGYFRTTLTSFELVPGPNGRTNIVERTSHELRLEPVLYWLPMARWVVTQNNARVLAHIRHQAERTSK
jgi:uncharacterized membrane protein YhaH (DUF805 family)